MTTTHMRHTTYLWSTRLLHKVKNSKSDVRPNFDSGDGALIVDLSCCLNKIALERRLDHWLEHPGNPRWCACLRLRTSHEHHGNSTRPAIAQPQPPDTMLGMGGTRSQSAKTRSTGQNCSSNPTPLPSHCPTSKRIDDEARHQMQELRMYNLARRVVPSIFLVLSISSSSCYDHDNAPSILE